jgi:hypothetical protein
MGIAGYGCLLLPVAWLAKIGEIVRRRTGQKEPKG